MTQFPPLSSKINILNKTNLWLPFGMPKITSFIVFLLPGRWGQLPRSLRRSGCPCRLHRGSWPVVAERTSISVRSDNLILWPTKFLVFFFLSLQSDDFFSLIEANEGKRLKLLVYNTQSERCREVVLMPNGAWGGEGRYRELTST